MGLIDKYKEFKRKRLEKAIIRNQKLIQNPKAIKEDRAAAIDFFKTHENPDQSVPALLSRFDYSLEHGINDTREKESAMEGILSFKDASLKPIVEHLQVSTKIAWPIKAFQAVANQEEVINALESCLNYGDISFDQGTVDKNFDILCYLRDYSIPDELSAKIFHFLDDHDERVRFAAVELLLEQKEPNIPLKLEKFLLDESAENTRIRQSVLTGFAKNAWKVNKKDFKQGAITNGFAVNKKFIVVSTD